MTVFRLTLVTSFLLLAACAPKPQVSETSQNLEALPPGAKPSRNQIETPAKSNSSALNKQALITTQETLTKTGTSKTAVLLDNRNKAKGDNSSATQITSWEISGALAARSKGKGWSASLNWVQRGAGNYQMRLSGPLGSGTILINKSGGTVTLQDGPKKSSSSNAESLLKQQTGVSLPVPNLYYWVRGIAAPGSVQGKKYDEAGRLQALRQSGYTIDYQQYTSVGKAVLPTSIRLQGNGIFMKLIIKHWRV
ncbi:MAG: outer membrane lipoprotein LolB [Tatlockia sp.]|nr:outer membrane lipoprotein LolB [Tatlockia sp.]